VSDKLPSAETLLQLHEQYGPVRICCGQRHWGVACPDGLVMCCVCFSRFPVDRLAVDPSDGKHWDVCQQCAADEQQRKDERS